MTAWKHSGAGLDHGKLGRGSAVGVGEDAVVVHGLGTTQCAGTGGGCAWESLARGNSGAMASADEYRPDLPRGSR